MSPLEIQVRAVLSRAAAPMDVTAIADALDDAATTPTVRALLGRLVHHGVAERHHTPAGLHYSLAASHVASERARVKRRGSHEPPLPHTTAGRVLEILAGKRMRSAEISEATGGELTHHQVIDALQRLQAQRYVLRAGRGPSARWQSVLAPPTAPVELPCDSPHALIQQAQMQVDAAQLLLRRAQLLLDDQDELPPCVGERMRDAMHDIARNGVEG